LSWLPDGRIIYQVGDSGSGFALLQNTCNFWTMKFDANTGKPIEKPKRLTSWTGFCIGNANATADGKRLAFLAASGHQTGYVADLEVGGKEIVNLRHFTLDEADDGIMDWTADSKTVIIAQGRGDNYGLYKQRLNAETPEPIVASAPGAGLEQALVSPDE